MLFSQYLFIKKIYSGWGVTFYADFTTAFSLLASFIIAVFLSLPVVHPLLEVKYFTKLTI